MDANDKIDVLFVEDNMLANRLGVLILEELNCRVDAVPSGAAAIKLASNNPYKIIFMDIGLPDMCGLQAIRMIRQSKLNKSVPIFALTAHSDNEYITQSYEAGATQFLVKPLSKDLAKEVLTKFLAYKQSQNTPSMPRMVASKK